MFENKIANKVQQGLHDKETLIKFADEYGFAWHWWQDLINIAKENIGEFREFVCKLK